MTLQDVGQPDGSGRGTDAGQFLTFIMAGEEYGVDILSVQEIRGWEATTPIPNAPSYVKGVVNLRGLIVPVADLRLRFGLEQVEYGPTTVVIVLKIQASRGTRVMGIVVDAVSDVYSISTKQIRPAPDLGDHINTSYIRGLVNVDDKMVILLEMNDLLGRDDLDSIQLPTVRDLN
jgi:purine-binding chemotaxis protein CheW